MSKPWLTCPAGHKLPHKTKAGRCTPEACAEPTALALKEESRAVPADERQDAEEREADIELALREKKSVVARDRRRAKSNLPQFVDPGDAEKWADEKLTKLLPEAVAELEYDLKYGDDKQRQVARQAVLDATGRSRREAPSGGGASIVIVNSAGAPTTIELPWRKKPAQTVEGEVTQVTEEKKP